MKQFIVLIAVLPIMLIFLSQFAYDQRTGESIAFIQNAVYAAKENAKQRGEFDEEIKKKIINDISKGLDIPESYISVETSEGEKRRYALGEGRLIDYKVSVRLDNVMAGGSLMGIKKADNYTIYVIDSYTASEKI
ncbi:MAG: hypothetical protein PHW03_00815 [Eubacteriales bacterium]|nr:hypothetical protein [Eubacteriales bacterium]MDD4389323.1 hypothetical protein [Eubacteriales bacterium]